MKLFNFWGPADSQKDLLKENEMLRGLVSEALTEIESTHELLREYMERLDSILDSAKKSSDGIE